MKILPIEKIREGDAYTIENEPIADIDLMERAAESLYKWIKKKISRKINIKVFCGPGNNGGDGLALARMLHAKGYHIEVYVLKISSKLSPSCKTNYDRLFNIPDIRIHDLTEEDPVPEIHGEDIVIDAIFGSGLSRPVEGYVARIINSLNSNNAIVIAVDAPSGMWCDKTNTDNRGAIIEADYTLTIQFPKYGFMFPENVKYVGHWEVIPIGIHPDFIQSVVVSNYLVEKDDCRSVIRPRAKFSHKGHFGHALLISGSYGKMGAASLASMACLKAGAGLVTTHVPSRGYEIIQTTVPEAMVSIDPDEKYFSEVPDLSQYNALAVGPGIGTGPETQKALKMLIQSYRNPIIFDADAINILGENKTWLSFLPKGCIFTPHPKEFERLAGKTRDQFERNELQRNFSKKHYAYVVLKGAHTAITCPDGSCYFNSTGNAGMATGGSGDVLTGVILGLLAQNYHPREASIVGVFIHGMAGDIVAERNSMEALIASDISNRLGKAILKILK